MECASFTIAISPKVVRDTMGIQLSITHQSDKLMLSRSKRGKYIVKTVYLSMYKIVVRPSVKQDRVLKNWEK